MHGKFKYVILLNFDISVCFCMLGSVGRHTLIF